MYILLYHAPIFLHAFLILSPHHQLQLPFDGKIDGHSPFHRSLSPIATAISSGGKDLFRQAEDFHVGRNPLPASHSFIIFQASSSTLLWPVCKSLEMLLMSSHPLMGRRWRRRVSCSVMISRAASDHKVNGIESGALRIAGRVN